MVAVHFLWVYVIHPVEGFEDKIKSGMRCQSASDCASGTCNKNERNMLVCG
jgi:hypothetical protein